MYSWPDSLQIDIVFENKVNKELEYALNEPGIPNYFSGGPILASETKKQIEKMKLKKAPGWDDVTTKHLKFCGPVTIATITWLMNDIVRTEVMPQH